MARIEVRGIDKSFGATHVLKGVSLDIEDREFVSLVGPSGCGKSTLLRIIAGLEAQDEGEIVIGGGNVDGLRPRDRNLAMVFQSYALYPHLTTYENIAVPLRLRRLSWPARLPLVGPIWPAASAQRADIDSHVRAVADVLDIEHLLGRKPGQLSGGQRQRVALGRAMVRDPAAFLMDEPLSNLDAQLRVTMRSEIALLHRRLDATFVYVTHDQAEAMTMSDRIAVMMGGEILQVDTPAEIYNRPTDVRVAEFIGSPKINLVAGEIHEDGAILGLGHDLGVFVESPPGPCQVGLRPERLRVVPPGPLARVSGEVRHIEYLGSEAFLHVAVDGAPYPLVVRREVDAGTMWRIGERAGLTWETAAAMVFGADGRAVPAVRWMHRERQHG